MKTFRKISLIAMLAIATATAGMLCSCHTLDDDRVPAAAVYLSFNTVAEWNVYGVAAAMDHRRFIRSERIPANYNYTAMSATGFGGVLLVADVMGNPAAYDLCCPVEVKQSVRVAIDPETHLAKCPVCGSTYDVFSLRGHPVDGPAAKRGYGLRPFRVMPGRDGIYMTITF